jgi:hypothetical protein
MALVGLPGVAALGAPVIGVDNASYEVAVQSGSLVSHTFLLTNTGDEILTIGNVQASCGCTTTTLAKSSLAPGESVSLEARVNTVGFAGTVVKTITVRSNDPANPNLVLRLTLTILSETQAQGASSPPASAPAASPAPTESADATRGVSATPQWVLPAVLVGGLALAAGALALIRVRSRR